MRIRRCPMRRMVTKAIERAHRTVEPELRDSQELLKDDEVINRQRESSTNARESADATGEIS